MAFKNSLNLRKLASKLNKAIQNTSPKAVAKIAQKEFKSNFDKGGFDNKKWKASKKQGRTLRKSGRLKSAIEIAKASGGKIIIVNRLPYATIHNEGGKISATGRVGRHLRRGRTVRPHTRQINTVIPKRQFMGTSKRLNRKIREKLNRNIKKVFR